MLRPGHSIALEFALVVVFFPSAALCFALALPFLQPAFVGKLSARIFSTMESSAGKER